MSDLGPTEQIDWSWVELAGAQRADVNRHISVASLHMTGRLRNCLRNDRCETLGEAADIGRSSWLRTPNFGRVSLAELEHILSLHGLKLAP